MIWFIVPFIFVFGFLCGVAVMCILAVGDLEKPPC